MRPRKDRPEIVVFNVRKKQDRITKVVPMFDPFPMLGLKRRQYAFFRDHLIEKQAIDSVDLEPFKVFEHPIQHVKDLVQ